MGHHTKGSITPKLSRKKLIIGVVILVIGFLGPLLIPFVVKSNLSSTTKSILSGLLAFGIPELFMLIAVAIMGKPGYLHIKGISLKYLRKLAPSGEVSRSQYRLGLVFFSAPLIFGFLLPYLGYYFNFFKAIPLWFHSLWDMTFIIGIFILGGDFWDKLSGLFQYNTKIMRES